MEGPFTKFQGIMLTRPYAPGVMEGYQEPENFPYCCPYHKEVLELAEAFFEAFPGNSEQLQQLISVPAFNLEDYKYEGAALNIVYRLSFTEHHIAQQLNKPDWFDEITNYIDYIIESFGTPAVAREIYTHALAFYLENEVKVSSQDKAEALLDYLCLTPNSEVEDVDLNDLYNIYNKWLSVFPFEIKPFRHLKEEYSNAFPNLIRKGKHNPYTQSFTISFKTKKQLLDWLLEKTERTLAAAESGKLIKAGLIQDKKLHRFELFWETHRTKQKTLSIRYSKDSFSEEENRYVEYIGEWLKNELEFFDTLIKDFSDMNILCSDEPNSIDDSIRVQNLNQVNLAIRSDIITNLHDVLTPFLPDAPENTLMRLLKGEQDGQVKLLFKENGNKLAFLFKELYDNSAMTGHSKIDVEQWLLRNFQYYDIIQKRNKDFTPTYLNGIISTNGKECKSPIASVKSVNGKLTIEPIKRNTKKYSKF